MRLEQFSDGSRLAVFLRVGHLVPCERRSTKWFRPFFGNEKIGIPQESEAVDPPRGR